MSKQFFTIHDIVKQFSAYGGRQAIVWFDKESVQIWTFAQLACAIGCGVAKLRAAGVRPADRIILCAPNSAAWICACLSVIESGATVVPVDIQADPLSLAHIVGDADPSMVITTAELTPRLQSLCQKNVPFLSVSDFFAVGNESDISPISPPQEQSIAGIFYTSGTTGEPKGVPLSHANIAYQVDKLTVCELTVPEDRVMLPLPLHHIYPFSIGLMLVLALGLPIILPYELTGPQLFRAIKEGDATILFGVPRLYTALYSGIEARFKALPLPMRTAVTAALSISKLILKAGGPHLGKMLLKPLHQQIGAHLRKLCSGGALLDPELAANLEALGWQIAIGYGLTETAPILCFKHFRDSRGDTVGTPLPGTEIRIDPLPNLLTRQTKGELHKVAGVEYGQILARGPGVFKGYRNRPDADSSAFLPDGWFRTGDVGYVEKNHLHVVGRFSCLIVTESGKKIDPEILEQHYAAHPYIREIGILQRDGKLVAVLVPEVKELQAQEADLTRLIHDAIDERSILLPTYKRLSGYVVSNEPLARTAMAKIQRHRLVERYESIRKGTRVPTQPVEALAAQDRLLIEDPAAGKVWKHLHKRFPDMTLSLDMSPQLDLGIDSLEWLNLTLEIAAATGIELDQEGLAGIRTLRDLLQAVAQQSALPHDLPALSLDAPEISLNEEQLRWLAPLSPVQRTMAFLLYWFNWSLMRLLFRVRVEGLENLKHSEHTIFAPNHASYIDAPVLCAALPYSILQNTQFTGWVGIAFANRLITSISRLAQAIPIDSDHALLNSIALPGAALNRGRNLVWFPEGRRSLTAELLPLRPGIALLLEHFPVAVTPVYLKGTAAALPPGDWLPQYKQVTVVLGKPVPVEALEHEGHGATRLARILDGLRLCLQRLIDEGVTGSTDLAGLPPPPLVTHN